MEKLSIKNWRNIFLVLSLFYGMYSCIYYENIFTPFTSTETTLIIFPIIYWFLLRSNKSIEKRYRDENYAPSPETKKRHVTFSNVSTGVLIPLILNIETVAIILCVIKRASINFDHSMSELTIKLQKIGDFIDTPLITLTIVLTIVTVADMMSYSYYKHYKKQLKYVTTPLKTIILLAFFVQADAGVTAINWKYQLNMKMVKEQEKYTMRVNIPAEQTKTEKKQKLDELIDKYAEAMAHVVDNENDNNSILSNLHSVFFSVRDIVQISPTLQDYNNSSSSDGPSGKGSPKAANEYWQESNPGGGEEYVENKYELEEIHQNNAKVYTASEINGKLPDVPEIIDHAKDIHANVNLEKEALNELKKEDLLAVTKVFETWGKKEFTGILNYTNDKAVSKALADFGKMNVTPLSAKQQIIKDVFKDVISSKIGGNPYATIIADPFTDMIFNGFMSIVGGEKSLGEVVKKIELLKPVFKKCVARISKSLNPLVKYVNASYAKLLDPMRDEFEKRTAGDLTYPEYLREEMDKYKNMQGEAMHEEQKAKQEIEDRIAELHQQRNEGVEAIVKKGESLGREISEKEAGEIYDKLVEEIRTEAYAALDKYENNIKKQVDFYSNTLNGEKYTYHFYNKNYGSPGGIFMGMPIWFSNEGVNCNYKYVPKLGVDCPTNLLTRPIQHCAITKDKRIKIIAGNKVYYSTDTIDKKLFRAAYNFVYRKKTYPVLISIFYLDSAYKKDAYNDYIIGDTGMTIMLHLADELIFNILENKIEKSEFGTARAVYKDMHDASIIDRSRIYDKSHVISINPKGFIIHSNIMYSVVSKNENEQENVSNYVEISSISTYFNAQKNYLDQKYWYIHKLNQFAGYQALLRSVNRSKVDIMRLLLNE